MAPVLLVWIQFYRRKAAWQGLEILANPTLEKMAKILSSRRILV